MSDVDAEGRLRKAVYLWGWLRSDLLEAIVLLAIDEAERCDCDDEGCPECDNRRAAWLSHDARACRACGCTDEWACDEGCEWVADDLCSSCAEGGLGRPVVTVEILAGVL